MSSTIYNGQVISQTRRSRSMTQSLSGVLPFRGQGVSYESGIERDFLRNWLLNPDVLAIVAQPAQIPFVASNGKSYNYPPDFFVHFSEESGRTPLLVEVKLQEHWKAHWREWKNKWKAARLYAQERGWKFRVYDEARIYTPRLQNIESLQRYRNRSFDPVFTKKVLDTLALMRAAPFHHLLALHFTGNEGIGRDHLLHLIATEVVTADLDVIMGPHTILRAPQ